MKGCKTDAELLAVGPVILAALVSYVLCCSTCLMSGCVRKVVNSLVLDHKHADFERFSWQPDILSLVQVTLAWHANLLTCDLCKLASKTNFQDMKLV